MSTEEENKSVGLSKAQYDVITNKIAVAIAKHEAVVQGWIAKSARANEPRKTQAELEAEDAALFRPQPPRLGLGCPIPPQFLKNDVESSTKDLRAKFFPSKTLKASKSRDAEEKAASAKRGLKDQSSDEEGGRSSLGRAKKLKKNLYQEQVKNEIQDIKREHTIEESKEVKPQGRSTKGSKDETFNSNTTWEDAVTSKFIIPRDGDGVHSGVEEEKLKVKRKKKDKQQKRETSAVAKSEQEDMDLTTFTNRPKTPHVPRLVNGKKDSAEPETDGLEVGGDVEEEERLRKKEAKKKEKQARKKERKEKRRTERATAGLS
jgi:hypothetical protein